MYLAIIPLAITFLLMLNYILNRKYKKLQKEFDDKYNEKFDYQYHFGQKKTINKKHLRIIK